MECDHSDSGYVGFAPWGGAVACFDCGCFKSFEYSDVEGGEDPVWIEGENTFIDDERWMISEFGPEKAKRDAKVRVYKKGDEPEEAHN